MNHLTDAYLRVILPGESYLVADTNNSSVLGYRLIGRITRLVNSGMDAFHRWSERRATIVALSALDDHELRDIGLHRGDVQVLGQGLVSIDEFKDGTIRDDWSRTMPSTNVLFDRSPSLSIRATGPIKRDAHAEAEPIDIAA